MVNCAACSSGTVCTTCFSGYFNAGGSPNVCTGIRKEINNKCLIFKILEILFYYKKYFIVISYEKL